MLHFNADGQIDLVYDPIHKCLVKSDIISDVLTIIGTTVDNPEWLPLKEITMKEWSGNYFNEIPIGSQLSDYMKISIIENSIINETVGSIKNALNSLIQLKRIKALSVSISANNSRFDKLVLTVIITLNDNQIVPLYFAPKG